MKEPYNWKTYGGMNMDFWEKHQGTSLEDAKNMFQNSHGEVIKLAQSFSNEELFSKGVYDWVGGSTLGSYFVSVTSSHYDWAMKKLKAHKKLVFVTNSNSMDNAILSSYILLSEFTLFLSYHIFLEESIN